MQTQSRFRLSRLMAVTLTGTVASAILGSTSNVEESHGDSDADEAKNTR